MQSRWRTLLFHAAHAVGAAAIAALLGWLGSNQAQIVGSIPAEYQGIALTFFAISAALYKQPPSTQKRWENLMATPSTSILGKIKNAFLSVATTGVEVLEKVLPFISPFLPPRIVSILQAGEGELTAVATIVTNTEAAFANAGAVATSGAKLAAASPQVQAIVKTWVEKSFPGSAKIQDQTGFEKGCADMTSAMVEILNAVGE